MMLNEKQHQQKQQSNLRMMRRKLLDINSRDTKMMNLLFLLVSTATLLLFSSSTTDAFLSNPNKTIETPEQRRNNNYGLQKSALSCNAEFGAPCSRRNAQYLAMKVTNHIYNTKSSFFSEFDLLTNLRVYNMPIGFYPFVFHTETGTCAAHGNDPELVGLTIDRIFQKNGLAFADGTALHERFKSAAFDRTDEDNKLGDWVQYLWKDGSRTVSKLAFVTNLTEEYYLGVGYENQPLPTDLLCSVSYDSWCSIQNVRSLSGKAQVALYSAESLEQFESIMFDISFDLSEYQIPGGFYAFMYSYDGYLYAHGTLHNYFGYRLPDIFTALELGRSSDGEELHQTLVNAAENNSSGGGWIQYPWRDTIDTESYIKTANIVKIEFDSKKYYLGVGYHFAIDTIMDGPLGSDCSDQYNFPCAFQITQQLSSHVASYVISSSEKKSDIFNALSTNPSFKMGNFYVFFYDFNETCVAHGLQPAFAGMTLTEVFKAVNVPLDAAELHARYKAAASAGGAWVLYDWLVPGVANSYFQKIAYMFQVNVDDRNYYGGIGFNHQRAPVEIYSDYGKRRDGTPILCSSQYALNCSEINARAILGQSLAVLTLASDVNAEVSVATSNNNNNNDIDGNNNGVNNQLQEGSFSIENVLADITAGNEAYRVNDFYVSVFSTDSDVCTYNDGSGCCMAHGDNHEYVYKTWQEILDYEQITSIRGVDLHNRLIEQSTRAGYVEYPWSRTTAAAQTKRSWTSRFISDGKSYYVVAEYLKTKQPPTCDNCPIDMECSSSDEQEFCLMKPEPPISEDPVVLGLIIVFSVGFPLVVLFFWYLKRRAHLNSLHELDKLDKQMKQMAEQMEQQMQGMVEVVHEMNIKSADQYRHKVGRTRRNNKKSTALTSSASSSISSRFDGSHNNNNNNGNHHHLLNNTSSSSLNRSTNGVQWYWEEDDVHIDMHKTSEMLKDTSFVKYSKNISDQIERAYQLYLEGHGYHQYTVDVAGTIAPGMNFSDSAQYELNFETMMQSNCKTKHQRRLRREVTSSNSSDNGDNNLDNDLGYVLPELPSDIDFSDDAEALLPTFYGQVIQVSKVHSSKEWLFGNVLYDPLMNDALKEPVRAGDTSGLKSVLADALHDRRTSGWFPKCVTKPAELDVMQTLLQTLGGEGMEMLHAPTLWDELRDGRVVVDKKSTEYEEVVNYFTSRLFAQKDRIKVVGVERIQNMPLWQSYSVKKQTMKRRDLEHPEYRVNNHEGLERLWLFHSTNYEEIPKIVKQGFNRAFAERNSVRYGKGVYFARDSCHISHQTHTKPDRDGVQRMFLCRVAVGDWCLGKNGQLAPDPKPHNAFELFDSTVDRVNNPSVFVVYHDAQAYPEYLVAFRNTIKK